MGHQDKKYPRGFNAALYHSFDQ